MYHALINGVVPGQKHDGSPNVVAENDVAFSLHALALTVVLVLQVLWYRTRSQNVSLGVAVVTASIWAVGSVYGFICAYMPSRSPFTAYEFVYFLSYVKLGVTLVKYVPQVMLQFTSVDCAPRDKVQCGYSCYSNEK